MSFSADIRGTTTHSIPVAVLACLAALASLALAPAASAQTTPPVEPRTTLPDIEDEVMCPVCGTLLELTSEAPQAQRQRAFIRDLIAQGYTKDQIKDALVAEFGEEVLATPDTEGFDLAAWLVPGLAFLGGAVAIGVGLRRWRRGSAEHQGGGDGDDQTPVDSTDAEKLDADLARYES